MGVSGERGDFPSESQGIPCFPLGTKAWHPPERVWARACPGIGRHGEASPWHLWARAGLGWGQAWCAGSVLTVRRPSRVWARIRPRQVKDQVRSEKLLF